MVLYSLFETNLLGQYNVSHFLDFRGALFQSSIHNCYGLLVAGFARFVLGN